MKLLYIHTKLYILCYLVSFLKQPQALIYMLIFLNTLDGQGCVNTLNVNQRGTELSLNGEQVIVLGSNFTCGGRIVGYLISLHRGDTSGSFPSIQIWRRSTTELSKYILVGTLCILTDSDITMMSDSTGDYYLGNVSCIGDDRIQFQSGDIIGYHQDNPSHYQLWNTIAMGYTSYHRNANNPLETLNINAAGNIRTSNRQPLIQLIFGTKIMLYNTCSYICILIFELSCRLL